VFSGLTSVQLNVELVNERSGYLSVRNTSYKRKRFRHDLLREAVKQMFWATFSGYPRKTGLIPLFGDPNSARSGVNRFVTYS
jgi:hypothetical protein